jgi:hypothetical protein
VRKVETAGENQQRFSIGTDNAGDGLPCQILRVVGEARIQRDE